MSPWSAVHTKAVQNIMQKIKFIPCLCLLDLLALKIVETNVSELGFRGILSQNLNNKNVVIRFYSGLWNLTPEKYSIIKKKMLSIVVY